MMPNVPQYPVAVAAVLRAGYVVVNVNPLYTAARTGAPAQGLRRQGHRHPGELRPTLERVHRQHAGQACGAGRHGRPAGRVKGTLVNFVVRKVKKMVPAFCLPGAVRFNEALAKGARRTLAARASGPTTSPCCSTPAAPPACPRARAAAPQHDRQHAAVRGLERAGAEEDPCRRAATSVCALPLYHIFALTVQHDAGHAHRRQATS
jgi:long-chain acyl-CoA synthetase